MAYEVEIAAILCHPLTYDWRAHGLGMLKTYLAPDVRLNLWHSRLVVPGTSPLHTHPWGLTSQIVAGQLTNYRWVRDEIVGDDYMEGRINCASFCGIEGEPTEVQLLCCDPEVYTERQRYSQQPDEIHHTEFTDGTITVMQRTPAETGGYASVFWPAGETYGDASRAVTDEDIEETVSAAARMLGL